MTALRARAFQTFFLLWTVALGLLCLPLLVLPRPVAREAVRLWARSVLAALRLLVGQHWELRGAEHLPRGAAVLAARHQSTWDTIVFLALLPDVAYILKRELFRIPFYGWYARKIGQIGIDRGGHASALKGMVREAAAALASGRQVVIFPEGTRTPPGASRPYQPGVAALYRQLGVPVIPVALNSGLYWSQRGLAVRPGTITLEILPQLPADLGRREFLEALRTTMGAASDRLSAAPAARHRS